MFDSEEYSAKCFRFFLKPFRITLKFDLDSKWVYVSFHNNRAHKILRLFIAFKKSGGRDLVFINFYVTANDWKMNFLAVIYGVSTTKMDTKSIFLQFPHRSLPDDEFSFNEFFIPCIAFCIPILEDYPLNIKTNSFKASPPFSWTLFGILLSA